MPEPTRAPTPGQTVGPFFHFGLIYLASNEVVAPGTAGAMRLHGTVRDGAGDPVPDALIELWQPHPDGSVATQPGHIAREGGFTGFGRAATDTAGRFSFSTLEPGPVAPDEAPFFALTVFARGLLDRLFTRAYLPSEAAQNDPFLTSVDAARRHTLMASADAPHSVRFDVTLQGDNETVFLDFDPSGTRERRDA